MTEFRTNQSLFAYFVMLFGLINAPANYQRFINNISAEQIDKSVKVYLDDILIYSKNPASHKYDICWVLKISQENKISIAPDKFEWNKTKLRFLGHMISTDSLEMCTDKIDAIKR